MLFDQLKALISRPAAASDGGSLAGKSLLAVGGKSAPLPLTLLAALRDTVRRAPESTRGIVMGIPFDRLERALASAGFDTAENLYSLTAPRRVLRFEDPATHTTWHLNESELRRAPGTPRPAVGRPHPVAPEFIFNDWIHEGKGAMRNRHTGRAVARPATLVLVEEIVRLPGESYSAFSKDSPPEEIIARLNAYRACGPKATAYIHHVLTLADLAGGPLDLARLCELLLDENALHRAIEFVCVHQEKLDPAARRTAETTIAALLKADEKAPPMALDLARDLQAKLVRGRAIHALDEFLSPGKIWHLGLDTPEERFLAHCLKRDLQRHLLTSPDSDDTTILAIHAWSGHLDPDLDPAALEHPRLVHLYSLATDDPVWAKPPSRFASIPQAFPRLACHASHDAAALAMLAKAHPILESAAPRLAALEWDRRLDAHAGALTDILMDTNIDGVGALERAARGATTAHP